MDVTEILDVFLKTFICVSALRTSVVNHSPFTQFILVWSHGFHSLSVALSLGCFIPEPLLVEPLGAPGHKNINPPDLVQVTVKEQPPNICFVCQSLTTPGRRQSKMPILSGKVDQNQQKQCLRLPFVAPLATNGNRKHCSIDFLSGVCRLLITFSIAAYRVC